MEATEALYTTPANAMKALSTEMSLTPTLKLQLPEQQQHHQQQQYLQVTPLSPLATTNTTVLTDAATTPTTPTTPRATSHTPREIPTMYILDQMYDDYMDQYNGNNITTPTEVPETNASVQLAPCPICARTFNPVTLRKHVGICEKMAMKKRNKFDSSRQRREGTELATYPLPKNFGLPEKAISSTSITQARGDRGQSPKPAVQQVCSPILARKKAAEDLIRTTARASMRKAVANNNVTTPTAPVATSTPSSNFNRDRMRSSERSLTRRGTQPPPAEQCPHCERCFGIKAYDRHVEWCKEKALLASIKQGSSKNEGSVAKARLEARIKYRAPCLKTKRSINREKYSGLAGEEPETEDNSKCSKTSLNKTQDDSLMTMSMTSSICSERKITNSTTGNINEPVAIKRQHNNNSVGNRKSTRDKNQKQQPPTKTEITTATATATSGGAAASPTATEHIQNEKSIINLEFEMPEFFLMGEQMTANAINKKRQANITKTKEVTVTAAKIKPLKQKQRQQQQHPEDSVEEEKDLKMNSKKFNKNSKTAIADIPINLKSMTTILEQNKSGSDLSLCNDECLQPTHKAFQIDNDYCEDRKHHYDDDVIKLDDEMESAATEEAPIENEDFSKSLTFYGSLQKHEENENILLQLSTDNTGKQMTMKEYFEKHEQQNFNSNYTTFSDNESENDTFEIISNDSTISESQEILMENANRNHTQDSCRTREEDYEKLIGKQSADDVANNSAESEIPAEVTKSLGGVIQQKNSTKSLRPQSCKAKIFNTDPKESETTSSRDFGGSENEDLYPKLEIYKDCLTDSNEFRERQITNKEQLNSQNSNPLATAEESSAVHSENYSEALKGCSKSETFIRDLESSKSFEDLSSDFCPIKPKIYQNNDTPTSFRLSTAPAQINMPQSLAQKNETPPRIMSLNVCQPKRKKVLRQTVSCTNTLPMKAVMWPLSMEKLETCGISSTLLNYKKVSKIGKERNELEKKEEQDYDREVDEEERNIGVLDKPIKVIKKPPQQLKRNKSFTVFGLPDNYDPFLSAKRQLEELCSSSADSNDMPTTPLTPKLPSMPATPNNTNNKMSTSLILSSSTPNTTPPSLMTTSQIPQQTQKTPILARSSSFRRTSSLRGPRRSPLLTTRPPLFAQKHRPTIQRGLSDEGPISTNFLKPEEYDEMPVRSVCVNDFAVNKSPRVVRRDTSASNRKQPLKLNISEANGNSPSNMTSPNVAESEVVTNNAASKYVSKTDSLAVFLKFEHDLEKLNTSSTDSEHKKENLMEAPATASTLATTLSKLDGLLNAKELKDKSNNLSKQNSAKNIRADLLETNESSESYGNTLNATAPHATNDVDTAKYRQVRLAPLDTKPNTPVSKPSTPQLPQPQAAATAAGQLTPGGVKNSVSQTLEQNTHKTSKSVALSSLFGGNNKSTKQTSLLYPERSNPTGSDYIDPKLINKWDNLPINIHLKHAGFKQSVSDTSEPRQEHFSSSSSESSAPAKKTTSQSQQAKFLPTVKQQQSPPPPQQQQQLEQQNNFIQNHTQTLQLPLPATNSQRNSAEGRNLLKRRMRLGRNQFLYDASPEGDSCSADDEGANRSSMEGDTSQQHYNLLREHEKAFERLSSVQANNPIDAPFMPPLPAFDDFDFEEFLSSFENDEEQFPLFKDCREFLMNRTSKKQRSMLMSNSTTPNSNTNTSTAHNSTNFKKSPSPQTFPPLTPQSLTNAGQHFQFPSLSQHPKNLFNSFSHNTRARNKYDQLTANKSSDNKSFCVNSQTEEYKDLDSQSINQKREIFISIETEQSDLDKSSISPNSIRNMVGNPQTVVEVEVDAAHDNKFSKISDDDDADVSLNNRRSKNFAPHLADEHLPNVQLNNAKNLMQKIQEDFRQVGDEISDNQRLASERRTAPLDVNMNTNSSITGNVRNMVTLNRSAAGPPSGDAYGDSDELSSLDGYPLSSPNSRLGVSSKTSADSAYGSLSRQRSSELTAQRSSSSRNRNIMSSNTANTVLNRPLTEETSLARSRQLSASSSSSSEHALPPITSSSNSSSYHKQQQQQQHLYNNNNNNIATDLDDVMRYELNNNNNNNSNYDGQPTHANLTGATNSHSNLESLQHYNSNSTMSTSMKMSKFCHECGSKFLLEQAKFCMDCGVKRIVL